MKTCPLCAAGLKTKPIYHYGVWDEDTLQMKGLYLEQPSNDKVVAIMEELDKS